MRSKIVSVKHSEWLNQKVNTRKELQEYYMETIITGTPITSLKQFDPATAGGLTRAVFPNFCSKTVLG